MGGGSSPRSLSHAGIRRLESGCQLPDAILRGKRSSCGLVAGPSCPLRQQDYRVRPLGPSARRFADASLRTGPRHACDRRSASWPFAPGRPPLLAMRWPGATGLTSYLSGCFSLTSQRCFTIAGVLEEVASLAQARLLPKAALPWHASRRFSLGDSRVRIARANRLVLVTQQQPSTLGVTGIRPGPKPARATSLGSEVVSHHPSPPGSLSASTAARESPPQKPVNPASWPPVPWPEDPEGPSQPTWPDLSPVTWDYPEISRTACFSRPGPPGSFNELHYK